MKIPTDLKWKATGNTLGQGGQGKVYEVIDKENEGLKYALKVLANERSKQAYERFYREIEAVKQLSHPHIIEVIDFSEPGDDFHFYVMELLDGARTIKSIIEDERNPYFGNPSFSLGLFRQILDVIHACEINDPAIIHRDLNLSNILVLPDEAIRVIDFGLCQIENSETVTLIDEGVGTPNFMAPECESGAEGEITSRADLYSAGKILWSVITGNRPFAREGAAFKAKSMNAMFPDDPQTWHLHHIFEGTIRNDPGNRWNSAEEGLKRCKEVQYLVASGLPPLELINEKCAICGVGKMEQFQGGHMVFGNPNPRGIASVQCNYCGYCAAISYGRIRENLEGRKELD